MTQNATQASLEDMVLFSIQNDKDKGLESLEEYYETLTEMFPEELKVVKEKLKNDKTYEEKMLKAIVEVGLLVFLLSAVTFNKDNFENPEDIKNLNIKQKFKEFLFASRGDDVNLYNMRTAYLINADGNSIYEEMKNFAPEAVESLDKVSLENLLTEYDSLREDLFNQYTTRFPEFKTLNWKE